MRGFCRICTSAVILTCGIGCSAQPDIAAHPASESTVQAAVVRGSEMRFVSISSSEGEIQTHPGPGEPPVTARLCVSPVVPGVAELTVKVSIAPGWHISAMEETAGPAASTPIRLKLPDGVATRGDWRAPEAHPEFASEQPVRVYRGDIAFKRQITVAPHAVASPATIGCDMSYQACDNFTCRPFETLSLTVDLKPAT